MIYRCSVCNKTYEVSKDAPFRCECGGTLDLEFEKKKLSFGRSEPQGLWRYIDALPFERNESCWQDVTMGEGMTPVFPFERRYKLYCKADYLMPSMSFKDRGAVALVSAAKRMGVEHALIDSSGNGGSAVAGYCVRAGIKCEVYVPEGTSIKKQEQIISYGAKIHVVPGTRQDTNAAAIKASLENGIYYASHIYNPFFKIGTKTYAYEIFEQFGGKLPEIFVICIGGGTLLISCYLAFLDLMEWGYIDHMPRLVGVQANNCAPVKRMFEGRHLGARDGELNKHTVAEGIAVTDPPRMKEVLAALQATGGTVIGVSEDEIMKAKLEMGLRGIYVEPTTAANYAGYIKLMRQEPEATDRTAIISLCGAGLKASD